MKQCYVRNGADPWGAICHSFLPAVEQTLWGFLLKSYSYELYRTDPVNPRFSEGHYPQSSEAIIRQFRNIILKVSTAIKFLEAWEVASYKWDEMFASENGWYLRECFQRGTFLESSWICTGHNLGERGWANRPSWGSYTTWTFFFFFFTKTVIYLCECPPG